MTASTVPMSVRIEAAQRDKLQAIAVRQNRSAHVLASEAIAAYIAQAERAHAFDQSCIASYQHYQETGLHVTHDELVPWLDALFTDSEIPPPECHK